MKVQKRLTLEGNICVSVGLFGHPGDKAGGLQGALPFTAHDICYSELSRNNDPLSRVFGPFRLLAGAVKDGVQRPR